MPPGTPNPHQPGKPGGGDSATLRGAGGQPAWPTTACDSATGTLSWACGLLMRSRPRGPTRAPLASTPCHVTLKLVVTVTPKPRGLLTEACVNFDWQAVASVAPDP